MTFIRLNERSEKQCRNDAELKRDAYATSIGNPPRGVLSLTTKAITNCKEHARINKPESLGRKTRAY